ncbi:hypothetical protein J4456_01250 [Candidatus Pacearchaeota archaeon]|nr:hypothetical protein [Candidatus Pacearchaeota archaeon]
MFKRKNAQLSVVIAVVLIVIVLIIAAIAITFLITKPSLIGSPYEDDDSDFEEEYEDIEILCSQPYMRLGIGCCLDINYNKICDQDEVKKEDIDYCDYPLEKIGSKCCRDDNSNNRCDIDERDFDNDRDYDEDVDISGPFSIYDYDIDRDEITLGLRNKGDETIIIESIEIEDCEELDDETILDPNERESFDFDCDRDDRFDRDIRIEYRDDSNILKVARGNIERKYERDYDY